jgi:sulfopyruvate decarboxylase TPP-binding subunit
MDYQLPVCMMVGLQGKEAQLAPAQSASYGVRIVEPVLDAMQIPGRLIETAADVGHIATDIEQAYRASAPFCFLVGRSPA